MNVTKVKTLKDFLNEELRDYAVYKTMQQLPHLIDGLAQTQRKILWVLRTHGKVKIADIYSLIYNETKYLHGDLSAKNVANILAAKWYNNVNLIDSKANFGSRTSKSAAAARYASTRYSKISKYMFPEIDKNIREKEYLEGDEIEPKFLLPILPIGLLNGFNGIAMGFSSSIISRDPIELATLLRQILSGKRKNLPRNLKPMIPYFKGTITTGANDKQFIYKGILKKVGSTKKYGTVEITELPPKYQRESFVTLLYKLEEAGKVHSFTDECRKNNFYFKIKLPIEVYEKTERELINMFGLEQKISENLTFIFYTDNDKEIREYDNIIQYLIDWIKIRGSYYGKRKQYILNNLKYKISVAENKANFIKDIVSNKLEIKKKQKSVISKWLDEHGYMKIDDDYDYLLRMPLWSLTDEKIAELQQSIQDLKDELKTVKLTDPKDMWIEDLDNLIPLLKQEIKEKGN